MEQDDNTLTHLFHIGYVIHMRPMMLTGNAPPKDPTVEDLVDQIFIEAKAKGIQKVFIERSAGIAHNRLWRLENHEYQPKVGELLAMCLAVQSDLIDIAQKTKARTGITQPP